MSLKIEQATLNRWLDVFEQIESLAEANETIPADLADELTRCVDGMRAMKARSNAALKAARTRKSKEQSKDLYSRIIEKAGEKREHPILEKIRQELIQEARQKDMAEKARKTAERETPTWFGKGEKTIKGVKVED